jgi:hypothetical protein
LSCCFLCTVKKFGVSTLEEWLQTKGARHVGFHLETPGQLIHRRLIVGNKYIYPPSIGRPTHSSPASASVLLLPGSCQLGETSYVSHDDPCSKPFDKLHDQDDLKTTGHLQLYFVSILTEKIEPSPDEHCLTHQQEDNIDFLRSSAGMTACE